MRNGSSDDRPRIAISAGDPGGIGPEVVVRAFSDSSVRDLARWEVFGSSSAMLHAAEVCGVEPMWWRVPVGSGLEATATGRDVVLIDLGDASPPAPVGVETAAGGAASFAAVEAAIAATMPRNGSRSMLHCDALVTAPISKAAWALSGRKKYPGHTELLRDRAGVKRVSMAFESPALRVVLATAHIPLLKLRDALTIGTVFEAIDAAARFCVSLGVASPRIGVCGLNPHAGEGGLLGDEDERLIAPAIEAARAQGIDASGPFPADTIYRRARLDAPRREFDIVVAMYHDQGLIPVKTLAFESAVNVTVGLPAWRTSPDHGTAFDIAGRGIADPSSMIAAMRLAVRLAGEGTP